jgi:hypothetical protein
MVDKQIGRNFDDEEHDSRYFSLIYQLLIQNEARYAAQTESLLKEKVITISVKGLKLEFRLTSTGCSYSTIESNTSESSGGWIRMGWGRASKRKALPAFFARAEASALMNQESE